MSRSSVLSGAVRVEPVADDRELAGKLADATLTSDIGRASLRLPDGSFVGLSGTKRVAAEDSADLGGRAR